MITRNHEEQFRSETNSLFLSNKSFSYNILHYVYIIFQLMLTTIHLCVCPATIELLNKVIVSATSSQDSQEQEAEEEIQHTGLWKQKPLVETDFWYLKTGKNISITINNI